MSFASLFSGSLALRRRIVPSANAAHGFARSAVLAAASQQPALQRAYANYAHGYMTPRFPPVKLETDPRLQYVDLSKLDPAEWDVVEGPREFYWHDLKYDIEQHLGPPPPPQPKVPKVEVRRVVLDERGRISSRNPFKQFRLNLFYDAWEANPVCLFVQNFGIADDGQAALRKELAKSQCRVHIFRTGPVRKALDADPRWRPLVEVVRGPVYMVYGPEGTLPQLLAAVDKHPERLALLAGRWGDQLLTREQLQALKALPSLEQMRAMLLATMESPATSLASTLSDAGGGALARALEQHRKQLDGTADESASPEPAN